jgi:TrmH family RNA methyltransferase
VAPQREIAGPIEAPSNARIKSVARLRGRSERMTAGLTLVDGAREVRRALDAGVVVVEAFVCEPMLAGPDARAALDAIRDRRIPVRLTTPAAFSRIAFGDRAEGIVAVVRPPAWRLDELVLPEDPLVIVVEGAEKPGNLGAVLRSADGAGADALFAASGVTDLANPNVIRASAGTVFAMPLAAAPTSEVIDWLRAREIRIVAAWVDADEFYTDVDLTGPLALAVGSEARGLTEAWAAPGIERVRLPMHGVADSLNVSVSAAVLLYEARRQRDRQPDGPH